MTLVKLKITAEVIYDADSENYGTGDPQEMADMDTWAFEQDMTNLFAVMEGSENHEIRFKVEPTNESTFVSKQS